MSQPAKKSAPSRTAALVTATGAIAIGLVTYIGGLWQLLYQATIWLWRGTTQSNIRLGRQAIFAQTVRLGVRALGVIILVSVCIGSILALQMAPPLNDFGQTDRVADIIAIAIVRELGPLISAIVLTGFAGASIAAELGTMVVGEEIEALRAHALNPVRFLVVPRLIATVVALLVLTVLAELAALTAGWAVGVSLLDIRSSVYIDNTIMQLELTDFLTGMFKAGVFGLILGTIASYNGLSVSGGAAGVGRATTNTVVHAIVAIIFCDLIFTALFFRIGLV
jgi:phospholipid/cholesterol/gamma-HCH transport system permease protein